MPIRSSPASIQRRSSVITGTRDARGMAYSHSTNRTRRGDDEHRGRVVGEGPRDEGPARELVDARLPRRAAGADLVDQPEHAVGQQLVIDQPAPRRQRRAAARRPGCCAWSAPGRCAGTSAESTWSLSAVQVGHCSSTSASVAEPSSAAEQEGRHALQRHLDDDAERPEARPRAAASRSAFSLAEHRSTEPSPVTRVSPATWVASPPSRSPLPWVPVEIARRWSAGRCRRGWAAPARTRRAPG